MQFALVMIQQAGRIWLEVAPWFLVGLLLAAALKGRLPTRFLRRWLGGNGLLPILRAAVIGTPLPLCSCSVLPTALQLRRLGASKGATVSFLVATPENGVDSIFISYVLLGPIMTVIRPVAAVASAFVTGVMTQFVSRGDQQLPPPDDANGKESVGCAGACSHEVNAGVGSDEHWWRRQTRDIFRATIELLDDVAGWLAVGILVAAACQALVPGEFLLRWGSGLPGMLLVLVISVPIYICATASTPLARSMLMVGISPGTVLVFLLAGPATNLASIGLLRRELGLRATVAYLAGITLTTLGLGTLVDVLLSGRQLNVAEHAKAAGELFPWWMAFTAAVGLGLLAIRPLRRFLYAAWLRSQSWH